MPPSPTVQSAPPFYCGHKPSERIAEMISSDHIASSDLTKTFLLNLAKIEAIEARLGREDLDKGEMDTLVKLCHEILNEMQELHLTSYVDNVFIHHKTAN